ncbi:MAG: polysaccharide deacetylase family protein [Salinivirgaceae bacterium]
MIIYCEPISPRLNYIFEYIFTERLGITYHLTQSWEEFLVSTDSKINYSHRVLQNGINIMPEGLLFETGIRNEKPSVTYFNSIPVIFRNLEEVSLTFDIFSAVFYFISRYEEYQYFEPDIHNRFPAKESLAFKNIFLNQPVVDHWILFIKQKIVHKYPDLIFKEETFTAIPTIDIDSPWCYRHKGILRNAGGLIRDLFHFKLNLVYLRLVVLFRLKPDPWFVFNWLKKILNQYNQQSILFVHVGKHGKFDKSVNSKNPFFRRVIQRLAKEYPIGLHPSYNSANKLTTLKVELDSLSQITKRPITFSRQHFLKIKLPEYYQMLLSAGITDDFSMGFADKPGFRAGTTRPFKWYDLKIEAATLLYVHPFAAMDRTINTQNQETVAGAQLVYNELIEQVRMVDGLFITLWHNESFNSLFEWKGWKELFELVLQKSAKI